MTQNGKLSSQRVVLSLSKLNDFSQSANVELINSAFLKNKVTFFIDTGSSVNLVKESVLCPETNRLINRNRIINLVGIGSKIVPTLGEVRLIIKGLEASFYVASESFPILPFSG